MKINIKVIFICLFMTGLIIPQQAYRFDINQIDMPFNNSGVLADVNIPPSGTLGRYNGIGFLFSGGFFLSGYNGNTLWANAVATATLVKDYQAGPVGSDPSAPEHKIYVVSVDDPPFGQSWQDWRDAVALGADFYDGDGDGIYDPVDKNGNGVWDPDEDKPDILGDLTAWCVFNDGVTANLRRWQSEPQGIEIQQTMFAYRDSHPKFANTQNTIFIRYRIINKGTVADILDSVYFGLWSDFDIGSNYQEDYAACDSILTGSYSYKKGPDPAFGNDPPAIYHHFNQFPHVFIPGETFIDNNNNGVYDPGIDTPLDTAYSHRGPDLGVRIIPGAKNISFASSVLYISGASPMYNDPATISHARFNMLGLIPNGQKLDPCTNPLMGVFGGVDCSEVNPVFWASGDPVANVGWIHIHPWDMRTLNSSGPFDLRKDDYYDIIVAYTLGHGTSPLNSVTVARENVLNARAAYYSNFGQFPVSVDDEEFIVNDFQLYQNYPNPFNPITTIGYQIPDAGYVTLKVYDVLGREIATLVNEERPAGKHEVNLDASQLASGVYYYQIRINNLMQTKKMILTK